MNLCVCEFMREPGSVHNTSSLRCLKTLALFDEKYWVLLVTIFHTTLTFKTYILYIKNLVIEDLNTILCLHFNCCLAFRVLFFVIFDVSGFDTFCYFRCCYLQFTLIQTNRSNHTIGRLCFVGWLFCFGYINLKSFACGLNWFEVDAELLM